MMTEQPQNVLEMLVDGVLHTRFMDVPYTARRLLFNE
jgi:hypothetical protein